MNSSEGLAARFKRARENAGLTKAEMARALGRSKSAVTLIENGATQSLSSELQERVTKVTGISGAWVATGHGSVEPGEAGMPSGVALSPGDAARIAELQIRLLDLDPDLRRIALDMVDSYLSAARSGN